MSDDDDRGADPGREPDAASGARRYDRARTGHGRGGRDRATSDVRYLVPGAVEVRDRVAATPASQPALG
jgi:hypothetical protein